MLRLARTHCLTILSLCYSLTNKNWNSCGAGRPAVSTLRETSHLSSAHTHTHTTQALNAYDTNVSSYLIQ